LGSSKKALPGQGIKSLRSQNLIEKALIEAGGKYKDALKIFNLEDNQYNNFMRFLHANRLTHLAAGV
jgi:hypothetical protein